MVVAYPVANKKKSYEICRAFIAGSGGGALAMGADKLYPGDAFFYGVDESNESVWRQVLAEKRTFYYCDNSYFDESRQLYFRVTRNATQHLGGGASNCTRFDSLDIAIKPWQERGAHVLVCPQSDHYMRVVALYEGQWLHDVLRYIGRFSSRLLRVRPWSANKAVLASTLDEDLRNAHCLVTWSSAAAISAVLRGIPVVVADCSAARVMGAPYFEVERLVRPEGRRGWAGVLADNQWTLDEFRDGQAWRGLNV